MTNTSPSPSGSVPCPNGKSDLSEMSASDLQNHAPSCDKADSDTSSPLSSAPNSPVMGPINSLRVNGSDEEGEESEVELRDVGSDGDEPREQTEDENEDEDEDQDSSDAEEYQETLSDAADPPGAVKRAKQEGSGVARRTGVTSGDGYSNENITAYLDELETYHFPIGETLDGSVDEGGHDSEVPSESDTRQPSPETPQSSNTPFHGEDLAPAVSSSNALQITISALEGKARKKHIDFRFRKIRPLADFQSYMENPESMSYEQLYHRTAEIAQAMTELQDEHKINRKVMTDFQAARKEQQDAEAEKAAAFQVSQAQEQLRVYDVFKNLIHSSEQFYTARMQELIRLEGESSHTVVMIKSLRNPPDLLQALRKYSEHQKKGRKQKVPVDENKFRRDFVKKATSKVRMAAPRGSKLPGLPRTDEEKKQKAAEEKNDPFKKAVRYDDQKIAAVYGFDYQPEERAFGNQNPRPWKDANGKPIVEVNANGRPKREGTKRKGTYDTEHTTPEADYSDERPVLQTVRRGRDASQIPDPTSPTSQAEEDAEDIPNKCPRRNPRGVSQDPESVSTFPKSGKRVGRPPGSKTKPKEAEPSKLSQAHFPSPDPPIYDHQQSPYNPHAAVPDGEPHADDFHVQQLAPGQEEQLHESAELLMAQTNAVAPVKKNRGGRPKKNVAPPPLPTQPAYIAPAPMQGQTVFLHQGQYQQGQYQQGQYPQGQYEMPHQVLPAKSVKPGRAPNDENSINVDASDSVEVSEQEEDSPAPQKKRKTGGKKAKPFDRSQYSDDEKADAALAKREAKSKKLSDSARARWAAGGMDAAMTKRAETNRLKKEAKAKEVAEDIAAGRLPAPKPKRGKKVAEPIDGENNVGSNEGYAIARYEDDTPEVGDPDDSEEKPMVAQAVLPKLAPAPKRAPKKRTKKNAQASYSNGETIVNAYGQSMFATHPVAPLGPPPPPPPPQPQAHGALLPDIKQEETGRGKRVRKPRKVFTGGLDGADDEEEPYQEDQLHGQRMATYASEYEYFQALASPKGPALGKRVRRSLIDLSSTYEDDEEEL